MVPSYTHATCVHWFSASGAGARAMTRGAWFRGGWAVILGQNAALLISTNIPYCPPLFTTLTLWLLVDDGNSQASTVKVWRSRCVVSAICTFVSPVSWSACPSPVMLGLNITPVGFAGSMYCDPSRVLFSNWKQARRVSLLRSQNGAIDASGFGASTRGGTPASISEQSRTPAWHR